MTAAGEDPAVYNVNDIRFSIYGEGIHIGRPAIVIELQGCSVGCAFCDCGQMWLKAEKNRAGSFEELHRIPEKWMTLPVDMLGGYALSLLPEALRAQTWQRVIARGVLAVVTGGEPAEQDVKPLARELLVGVLDLVAALLHARRDVGHRRRIRRLSPARIHAGLPRDRAQDSSANAVRLRRRFAED